MTPITAALIVAAAANIAAAIAIWFASRDLDKADEAIRLASLAIDNVSSSRFSRAVSDAAPRAAISALAQASASCHRSDCGPEPSSPLAMQRITSNGPMDLKCSSSALSMSGVEDSVSVMSNV